MAKGGARANSGPPPEADALRRDRPSDRAGWKVLPAAGRAGDPPEWPLTGAAAHIRILVDLSKIEDDAKRQRILDDAEAAASAAFARELELWAREWRRPQAVEWERLGLENEVALYVRSLAHAEHPDAPVTLRTLIKQQQEALGLSLPGLARLRWRVGEPEPPEPKPSAAPRSGSARSRFRVVPGGDGGRAA